MKPRYFAIVVKVPAEIANEQLGNIFTGSTVIGETFRRLESELPAGSRVTRSIEITESFATQTWTGFEFVPLQRFQQFRRGGDQACVGLFIGKAEAAIRKAKGE